MQRLMVLGLLVIAGCTGGHALDNPIKTCKAVTVVLAGERAVIWHAEKQTEQPGVQLQVTLDFSLAGQAPDQVSQVVCNYGLSSDNMDYRNTMGEYANTPTSLFINGMPVLSNDLVQAINRATADTAAQVIDAGRKSY